MSIFLSLLSNCEKRRMPGCDSVFDTVMAGASAVTDVTNLDDFSPPHHGQFSH
jgi:hypothetical protein